MLSFRRLTDDQTRSEVTAPSQSAGDASFHPAVSSGDFDRVVELNKIRQLTDQENYYLVKNHFSQISEENMTILIYALM